MSLESTARNGEIRYSVQSVQFFYGKDFATLPNLEYLSDLNYTIDTIPFLSELFRSSLDVYEFSIRDVRLICEIPLLYLHSLDYEGVIVFPDPNQIDPFTGKDLRKENDLSLRIAIWVSQVESVDYNFSKLSGTNRIGFYKEQIEGFLLKEKVNDNPLRKNLYRFANRLNKYPYQSTKLALLPSESNESGKVNTVISIDTKKRFSGTAGFSNSGTETLGIWNHQGAMEMYPFCLYDDSFRFNWGVSNTFNRQSYSIIYKKPVIFPDILEVGFQLSHSEYDASTFALTKINFSGKSQVGSFFINYQPLDWENSVTKTGVFFQISKENVEASNNLTPLNADASFMTPEIGIRNTFTNPKYIAQTTLSVRGNTQKISSGNQIALGGIETEDQSLRIRIVNNLLLNIGEWLVQLDESKLSKTFKSHKLLFSAKADWCFRNVRNLPKDQFILGGTGSVRGYPESPTAGDKGYLLSAEYKIPLGRLLDFGSVESGSVDINPFVDWGEAFVHSPFAWESDQQLLGAGLGLDIGIAKNANLELDFAKPLKTIITNGNTLSGTGNGDARIHAALKWTF